MNSFFVPADPAHIKKERAKAREMKRSQWWKSQLADGHCHHCGQSFAREDLTMDHLIPVVRGGKTRKGNVVVSCRPCNSRRKYHTPAELALQSLNNCPDD